MRTWSMDEAMVEVKSDFHQNLGDELRDHPTTMLMIHLD